MNWHDNMFKGDKEITFDQARKIKMNMAKSTNIQPGDMDWSDEAIKAFQKWLNSSPIDWIRGK